MKLIKLKPITNSLRHQLNLKKSLLAKKNNILKNLKKGKKNGSGRSSLTGHITINHKGNGCKQLYRIINMSNKKFLAIVVAVFYDPNRTVFISLNYNLKTKSFFQTLANNNVLPGTLIFCSNNLNLELRLGCRNSLNNIPAGSLINSLSSTKKSLIKYIRSAGTFGQLIQKDIFFCKIKLPSGKIVNVSKNAFATLGILSNLNSNLIKLGKAGRNRHKNIRPSVRGIAMNPVDHPHGGRTNGGKPCVTPWGKPTKGQPTVKKKNFNI